MDDALESAAPLLVAARAAADRAVRGLEELGLGLRGHALATTGIRALVFPRLGLNRHEHHHRKPHRAHRSAAEKHPGEAGRVPLPRPEGRRSLRGKGEVPAIACALVLSRRRLPAGPGEPHRAGRAHRGDRDLERDRGLPSRAEPHPPAPAAIQRPPARRQVLSVHRRDRGGRLPARHVHARAAPSRGRLLRPVREREEGARDARRPQPRLPVPALRRPAAGAPFRHPVPRLPHRPLPGPVCRLRLEGGLPGDCRARDRVPLGRDPPDPAGARGKDARGGRRAGLRGCRPLPEPALLGSAPGRAPGGGQARDRRPWT